MNNSVSSIDLEKANLAAVLTWEDLVTLKQERCSGNWKSVMWRARKIDYLLLVANKNKNPHLPYKHGEAFLLVKVTSVEEEGDRKLFNFSEYAEISIPNAWQKLTTGQFPVAYYDNANKSNAKEAFNILGLDFDKLTWHNLNSNPLKENSELSQSTTLLPVPQAISQAKILIFETTGIPIEQIKISIDDF